MLSISVSKALFDDIVTTKQKTIEKEMTPYWKKELLDIKIVDDAIRYDTVEVEKLKISNGLGKDKPTVIAQCEAINYNAKKNLFEIIIGDIIEQRNTFISEDYKDNLIKQLLKEKEELKDNMHRDHLTSVYNRRKMEEDLDAFVNQRNANSLCAIFVDADRFKGINDFFGHDAGDDALRYIARKLDKHAKLINGEVYRYGGEEFILLCFMPKGLLLNALERLREDIKSEMVPNLIRPISLTVSMGVAFFDECKTKEQLIKTADEGVYKAKENGRDRIELGNS